MNARNGIPIQDYAPKKRHNYSKPTINKEVWKTEFDPFQFYVEMSITIDNHESSIIMPANAEWIKGYKSEGWKEVCRWKS